MPVDFTKLQQQLTDWATELGTLQQQLNTASGAARTALAARIADLRTKQASARQQLAQALDTHLTQLDAQRDYLEQQVRDSSSDVRAKAQEQLAAVKTRLADTQRTLHTYTDGIMADVDHHIETLTAQAASAKTAADAKLHDTLDQLRGKREVLKAQADVLRRGGTSAWRSAKQEFDKAMDELRYLRDHGVGPTG